jgi:hypothetical protein
VARAGPVAQGVAEVQAVLGLLEASVALAAQVAPAVQRAPEPMCDVGAFEVAAVGEPAWAAGSLSPLGRL